MDIVKIFNKYRIYTKYAVITIIILVCGLLYYGSKHKNVAGSDDIYSFDNNQATDTSSTQEELYTKDTSQTAAGLSQDIEDKGLIYVYIYGEVESPGVVECTEGLRVYEAVGLCGGYTDEADVGRINPVRKVSDGDKIYIPRIGEEYSADSYSDTVSDEASYAGGEKSGGSLININTATKEQLVALSGIGDSRAEDIISYRSKHGSFKSIEDIKNVPGIKESTFSKIKDYICV
jgi:competence protein ComEA